MPRQLSMPVQFPPVSLLPNAADAAGRTGGYRSLRNCVKAWIVCRVNQGNAAQVTFTPLQATDNAGAGSKPIAATPIWLNNATASSDAFVKQTAAANFQTSVSVADKIVIFEILPQDCMDVGGGFDEIALQTSASNAANITSAMLYIWGAYQQATPPTSYV